MKRYLVSTALAAILASGTAFAAEQPKDQAPAAIQSSSQTPGSLEFISSQQKTDWMANSLIGRSVQNQKEETLGEINDVVLDSNGQVSAVLIGVGGFLGIGEKNVGIPFDSLEFREKPVKPVAQTTTPPAAQRPGGATGNPMAGASQQTAPREDYTHANMIIVLNASKEQLEAAPAYQRLGQEAEAPKASSERLSTTPDKKSQ